MATQSGNGTRAGVNAPLPAGAATPRGDGHPRYELNVIAGEVADIVESIGGWLFDTGMLGWEIDVLVPGPYDTRPILILGAIPLDQGAEFAVTTNGQSPAAIAVCADLFDTDERIRTYVLNILNSDSAEVMFFGDSGPPSIGHNVEGVVYRLSQAARVFKSHALAAAAVLTDWDGSTETLFRVEPAVAVGLVATLPSAHQEVTHTQLSVTK